MVHLNIKLEANTVSNIMKTLDKGSKHLSKHFQCLVCKSYTFNTHKIL